MFIAILIATPLLLAFALAVRFAGSSKVLNIVDYSKITDPRALHHWAGNRLLVLALATGILAGASLATPSLSFLYLAVFFAVVILAVIWLAVGSAKFQVGAN